MHYPSTCSSRHGLYLPVAESPHSAPAAAAVALVQAPGSSRDLLLLDLALENWFRLCIERTDLTGLQVGGCRQDRQASRLRHAQLHY